MPELVGAKWCAECMRDRGMEHRDDCRFGTTEFRSKVEQKLERQRQALERARQRREEQTLRHLEAPVYAEKDQEWRMHDFDCPCPKCESDRERALDVWKIRGNS